MAEPARQMHLNLFIQGVGHHEAAWRHPNTNPMNMLDVSYYQKLAQQAEAAKLDSIFIADAVALNGHIEHGPFNNFFEPFTLLSAVAAVTERIGIIGTASTTYSEPYNVARLFASLDRVSQGRAGWNIVTSANEAAAGNFGHDAHLEHTKRYERATEFLEVVTALWDGWEDDALTIDRESGQFVDRTKLHAANHSGEWFTVRGPLDMPRPPQGRPVLVQAGSSPSGREFAGRYAEAIYTAQYDVGAAREFYNDVKERMQRHGRAPGQLAILPGLAFVVGDTEKEALAKQEDLNEYIVPEYGLHQLSQGLNMDLSDYPLDGPLPEVPPIETINGGKSRYQIFVDLARKESLSLRQLIKHIAFGRGHGTVVGTPEQIVDYMEHWFTTGACDGFNLLPPHLPSDMEVFTQQILPELRRRGLFREDYSGPTLRDHLGLIRPENRFTTR